jgi:predicted nucleic acid-binding protein
MTARFFADTNIAVYSLDEDSDKRQRCFEILRRRPVISVQVINEFLSVLLSKRRIDRPAANRLGQILFVADHRTQRPHCRSAARIPSRPKTD